MGCGVCQWQFPVLLHDTNPEFRIAFFFKDMSHIGSYQMMHPNDFILT